MFVFLFCTLFSILSILCFGVFCELFVLLYKAVSFPLMYKFTDQCELVETHLQLISILSYHIAASRSQFSALHFFTVTPSNHIPCSLGSKHNKFPTPIAKHFKQKERLTARSVSIS